MGRGFGVEKEIVKGGCHGQCDRAKACLCEAVCCGVAIQLFDVTVCRPKFACQVTGCAVAT
jgi:hypothetical protein